jgi:hypothetical protein
MGNDLLTPLAILGIVVFGVLVLLVAALLVQQALRVRRLLRSGNVKVTVSWGRASAETSKLEPGEQAGAPLDGDETKKGWGFD